MSKYRWIDWAASAAIFLCVTGLVLKPVESTQSARDGLQLCLDIILPSLFPFFVLSTLMVELGVARYLGYALERVMRPLFNVNGACGVALAMGLIGGYPVGARTALSLYQKRQCSKEEAERLLSFCNNSGPAFIFGVVGAGVFASSRVGLLLYLAHAAASVTVGLVFRFYKYKSPPTEAPGQAEPHIVKLTEAFTRSVTASFQSVINICAFVIFFTVAIRMLFISGLLPAVADALGVVFKPIGIDSGGARQLLTGLIELTSGLWSLQGAASTMGKSLSMAAFMLGWAGISVHAQVLSFLSESGLKTWTYVTGKLLHGGISAVYAFGLARLFRVDTPVSDVLAGQISELADMRLDHTLLQTGKTLLCLGAAAFIWVVYVTIRRYHRGPRRP